MEYDKSMLVSVVLGLILGITLGFCEDGIEDWIKGEFNQPSQYDFVIEL